LYRHRMPTKVFMVHCMQLTILRFGQRNAWHSIVSLSLFRAIYANTRSWTRSAVQKQILNAQQHTVTELSPVKNSIHSVQHITAYLTELICTCECLGEIRHCLTWSQEVISICYCIQCGMF